MNKCICDTKYVVYTGVFALVLKNLLIYMGEPYEV